MSTEVKKANFLVKFNNEIKLISLEVSQNYDFSHFRNIVRSEFDVSAQYKMFFYIEHNGNSGCVPFDPYFFNEIMSHVQEFGPTHIVNIRVHTVWNFIFSASLAHDTVRTGNSTLGGLKTGSNAVRRKRSEALPQSEPTTQSIKSGPVVENIITLKADTESQMEVDEWQDITENGSDEAEAKPVVKKVLATDSCTITVSDPVPKPKLITTKSAVVNNNSKTRELSPPSFPTPSKIPNYSSSSKYGPVIETAFYEKNGPTGSITKSFSKLTPKIQIKITNNGTETLNNTFKIFKVSGNCSFAPAPLPVTVTGKTKVVTIKPEFDTQGNTSFKGLALFALGYEQDGN